MPDLTRHREVGAGMGGSVPKPVPGSQVATASDGTGRRGEVSFPRRDRKKRCKTSFAR